MNARYRRGLWGAALVAALVVAIWVRDREPIPDQASGSSRVSVMGERPREPERGADESGAEPGIVASTTPRFRFKGLPASVSTAGIRVEARIDESTVLSCVTDALGELTLDARAPVRFAAVQAGWRLANPERAFGDGDDVYVVRMTSLHVQIEFLDVLVPPPTVHVVVAPSDRVEGEWVSDPARVGSSGWLAANAPGAYATHAWTTSSSLSMDVPWFPRLMVGGTAPGFLPDRCTAEIDAAGAPVGTVKLVLRRARNVSVRVMEEDGAPVVGATFQYAVHRREPRTTSDPAAELAMRELDGSGVTMRSSRSGGWTETSRLTQTNTDAAGCAALTQTCDSNDETLVVWAPGHRPFVLRRDAANAAEDPIDVRLQRVAPACASYRLVRGGRPLQRVSVILAEPLGGGFSPAMPTITSDSAGAIPSDSIVPGTRYVATVIDALSGKVYTGQLAFYSVSDVEIDGLRE